MHPHHATLNVFLDRHGILDADYQQALADGKLLWVIRGDRLPFAWPGRYMVIVDSETSERPAWSPLPGAKPVKNINPAARQASQAQVS